MQLNTITSAHVMDAMRMAYAFALFIVGTIAGQAAAPVPEVIFNLNANDSLRLEHGAPSRYSFILKPANNVWAIGDPIEINYYLAGLENQQCRIKNVKAGRYILFVLSVRTSMGAITTPVGRFTISRKSASFSLRIPEWHTQTVTLPMPPEFNPAVSWPSLIIESHLGPAFGYRNDDVTLDFDRENNIFVGEWEEVPKSGTFQVTYRDRATDRRLRCVDVEIDPKSKLSEPVRFRFASKNKHK